MHPEIAKRLIVKYTKNPKDVVFDPFMGSGGVLVEALLNGNNSVGIDVNPFAVLLSQVKTTTIIPATLQKTYESIISEAKKDYSKNKTRNTAPKSKSLDLEFWYKSDVAYKLSILKHHILEPEKPKAITDFFKVCFSLTSRNASNQRNSIYKIYRMDKEKLEQFNPDVFEIFAKICSKNIEKMVDFRFAVKTKVRAFPILGDSRNVKESFAQVPSNILEDGKVHLVVTSPPYGDHGTTVAYGQFSKHPGLWLDLPEEKLLDVDSVGLGGKKKKEFKDLESPLLDLTLKQVEKNDKELSKKKTSSRAQDVYSFFYDLDLCLEQISGVLKPNQSHCCFVVANRTVRRIKIPTDQIIVELGKKHGLKYENTIYRTIANKAMAVKNAPENIADFTGETMTKESIVIWKY
jgi:DNA modification methylase